MFFTVQSVSFLFYLLWNNPLKLKYRTEKHLLALVEYALKGFIEQFCAYFHPFELYPLSSAMVSRDFNVKIIHICGDIFGFHLSQFDSTSCNMRNNLLPNYIRQLNLQLVPLVKYNNDSELFKMMENGKTKNLKSYSAVSSKEWNSRHSRAVEWRVAGNGRWKLRVWLFTQLLMTC